MGETKKTGSSKTLLVWVLLVLVIGSIFAISLMLTNPIPKEPVIEEIETKETEEIQPAKFEDTGGTKPLMAEERLEERYSINRANYSIHLDEHDFDTFGSLPEIPEDFGTVSYLVHSGKLTDFDEITREHFLQPEFFPLFVDNGLKFYKGYTPNSVGTFGWGVYPSEQGITAIQGTEGEIEFFFKTGWGVETWQGMKLLATSNCKWLTVEMINPVFITPPSYPEFCTVENCGHDWARKKQIRFKVSETVPINSQCRITMQAVRPPPEKINEWFEKYRAMYVTSSGSMVTAGIPLIVDVRVVE